MLLILLLGLARVAAVVLTCRSAGTRSAGWRAPVITNATDATQIAQKGTWGSGKTKRKEKDDTYRYCVCGGP
jgi:hypothetical protein